MEILLLIFFACLGALVASFIGVIVERIYTGTSWVTGRSACNSCRTELSYLDLIPVLSWLVWRGRCRVCRSRVPALYMLSEAVLGALFALTYVKLGLTPLLLLALSILGLLAFIVLYDLRHTIVPPLASYALVALAALYTYLTAFDTRAFGLILLVAGIFAAFFLTLHAVSRGRWMGLGDTPVVLALSLFTGLSSFSGLLFSFWIGGAIGIVILVLTPRGHRIGIEVPFVPFLAAGFLLAYFTGWNALFF